MESGTTSSSEPCRTRTYRELPDEELEGLLNPGATLADIKGMWRGRSLDPSIDRWTL